MPQPLGDLLGFFVNTASDLGRDRPTSGNTFGAAYKGEVAAFIECCRAGAPFPVTPRDGVRAQQVISAGMQRAITRELATAVN